MENKRLIEYKKKLEKFAKSLKDKDLEALKVVEQDVIKECDEVDKKARGTVFKLASKNQKEVAQAIRMLLNKQSVQWQYTQGYVSMYEFWTGEQKEVEYDLLDSTLRTLGGFNFTGYDEWKAVILINDYMKSIREEYADVTQEIFYMAEKHNAVMQEMQLKDPNIANGETVAEPEQVEVKE